jgi:uncharacterized flavoprotein (TIGR03862 family)
VKTALIIGGGPAGLMSASVLSDAGVSVTIADAMPSLGRKFLMAGKSGLNLTKDEPEEVFLSAFGKVDRILETALASFGQSEVKNWATSLGQEIFTGSTGRVFPKSMKASPLLRAWLNSINARVMTRHRWIGWDGGSARFETAEGTVSLDADVTILALGGASWSRLGSTGKWAQYLHEATEDFQPSNVGFKVDWSEHMAKHFGSPVKGTLLSVGDAQSRGEWIISASGIEGGGVYGIAAAARNGAEITIDLLPDWSIDKVRNALKRPKGKMSLSNYLRKTLRLDSVKFALLSEFARPLQGDLAPIIKGLRLNHAGPFPIDQAISTAGGLRFDALTPDLMLHDREGVFCAGEMLDWDAPTGGYLITACLATGRTAGLGALAYLNR